MKRLPDFLIIGAARCGTSSFYKTFLQHPGITGPAKKEIHFFDSDKRYEKGIEWYKAQFPEAKTGQLLCEATPIYLHAYRCPLRILKWMPRAKLIVLLRDPTARAWSHFWANRERHNLNDPKILINGNKMGEEIKTRGLYYDQLLRWLKPFANGQMAIVKSETFFEASNWILNKICKEFLDIKPFDFKDIYWDPKKRGKEKVPPMPPEVEENLRRFYKPHNRKLEKLTGVKFKWA